MIGPKCDSPLKLINLLVLLYEIHSSSKCLGTSYSSLPTVLIMSFQGHLRGLVKTAALTIE